MSPCVGVACSGALGDAHLLIDHIAAGNIYANHLVARAFPRGRDLRMPEGHLKVELAVAGHRPRIHTRTRDRSQWRRCCRARCGSQPAAQALGTRYESGLLSATYVET
jgi:hypothetical protein